MSISFLEFSKDVETLFKSMSAGKQQFIFIQRNTLVTFLIQLEDIVCYFEKKCV